MLKKHVIKIDYEGDIRKYRNITDYSSLIISIAKTLGFGVINCRFTYVDDDNDRITVNNDDDLQEAITFFEPRIAKLALHTYNEEVDASISDLKLCDSGISAEMEKIDHCQKSESEKVVVDSNELPLQLETEDRPMQVKPSEDDKMSLVESVNEISVNDSHAYQQLPDESVEIFESIAPDFEIPDQQESVVPEPKPNMIWEEDRPLKREIIKPKPAELPLKVASPEIKLEAKIDLDSLKEKIQEIVKIEAEAMIPKLLQQFKPQECKNDTIHYISCDMCKSKSIVGYRYKCSVCPNYDLCGACEAKNKHTHPFLKIKSPQMYQSFLKHLCSPHGE